MKCVVKSLDMAFTKKAAEDNAAAEYRANEYVAVRMSL